MKNQRMTKAALSVLATLLSVSAISSIQSAQAETVLRLSHFAAETHPGHIAAKQFKENVEKRTNGEVVVELYPANELGAPPEQLEQTVLGIIDMNLPTQGALDKYEKAFGTVMTPFAFSSYDEAHRVLDGPFMEWAAPKLEKQGLVMLSNWEYGFRNVTNSVRPTNSPDDLAGLKLRTPPELQIVAALEAAGAQTTQIAFPELPGALTAGVVDGQENPIGVIYHNKLYELQDHLALTRHVYNSMVHVMNKAKWDALSGEEQTIVREESVAAGNLMRKLVQEQEEKELAAIKESGVQVTEPDLAKFKAKMGPAYERVSEYSGEENMKTFLGFLEN
ncbi:TRAP transporter substrate-binding protein [Thalassospira xiamenensis]|uniref:Tripartite ATP-independent transporter solute receptor, DctP family n=1 Tax=Thalassospira xiamenensis TaxID=220697 RepID=A0A285TI05_9PROT|nr:TRAP transporter substrate-binding protein [Thalassospira xiamenensis]SOC20101.1 tripartite ATP-independent transporter solute receptor, DctP family [Thalassospira xiamenensis]